MSLYQKSLVLTLESLIGKYNNFSKKPFLENCIILSKIRFSSDTNRMQNENLFDLKNYLQSTFENNKLYFLLIYEMLYLLNLKKKFTSKNNNRIVNNYFELIISSMQKKINLLTIPEQIIDDREYLTSLALTNLYTINQIQNEKKNI